MGSDQAELFRRARGVLPGSVLGGHRLPEDSDFIPRSGNGAYITASDGRQYLDYVLGSGPMILGHAHPAVTKAIAKQAGHGTTFYAVTESAIELAEEIIAAMPSGGLLRFCSSGSEATLFAMRLARAFTNRSKILKFEGAFHGNHDYAQISVGPTGPPDYPKGMADSGGIPAPVAGQILIAPFNDMSTTATTIAAAAGDIAAVIVEPYQRIVAPHDGFLAFLRDITRQYGILLIFDELVTGFRLAYGGAQEFYGVTADIVTYGKIIGGGLPVAAVAGREDVMQLCDPAQRGTPRYVYLSGTLSGFPLGMVAGLATLQVLRETKPYPLLFERGVRIREYLAKALKARGIGGQVLGEGPMFHMLFTERKILSYRDTLTANARRAQVFARTLLREGLYVIPGMRSYISTAHSDEDLARTFDAFNVALDAAAREPS